MADTTSHPADPFLASIIGQFHAQKSMAERAVVQLPDEKLRVPLDENTNSIAVIMKHMSGNLISRFTDFLTSDGEKAWRNRDGEFVDDFKDRQSIMAYWERGWKVLFETLGSLRTQDLEGTVLIRTQRLGVIDALLRALTHQSYHVGQIVQLARHLAGDKWTTLTIARGKSEQFNQQLKAGK
jgi:uncharacterized damage-inducible protein DinB